MTARLDAPAGDGPAAIDELVGASRARQGLPPKVTDPATVARLAALIANRTAGPDRDSGPADEEQIRAPRPAA